MRLRVKPRLYVAGEGVGHCVQLEQLAEIETIILDRIYKIDRIDN